MRTVVTAALLALLAAVAVASPAVAQDRPAKQEAVYRDFEDDGFLDACDHDEETLQAVLDGIGADADADTPGFRPKVEAALAQVQAGECADRGEDDLAAGGTADDTTGGSPTKAPEEEPTGSGASSGPPTAADVDPLPPEPTPVPAATPVPTAVPATPAAPGAASVAYRNEDDDVPGALLALAGLLGALALLALAYALLSRIGWVDERLAGSRRTWREAGFRAGGIWGDFTDWLRLGR